MAAKKKTKKTATKKKTAKPATPSRKPKRAATPSRKRQRPGTSVKKRAAKKTAAPSRKRQRAVPAKKKAQKVEAPESVGALAIDAACEKIHPGVKPLHYIASLPAVAGGNDPLDGISVYACDRGEPHWHYITYGFSDLHEKSSDDPEASGFGFELTFRLRRGAEKEPPAWACSVLQNLARYVFRTGNPFGVGHHVPLNGPIALGAETEIQSVAFARDPELDEIDTPFGNVEFLQMVGITRDEAKAIKRWSSLGMLEMLAERDPLLITALDRRSVLEEPGARATIAERTKKEGSSSAASFTTQLAYRQEDGGVHLQIGAIAVEDLIALLESRIFFGRDFSLMGRGTIVSFRPAETAGFGVDTMELAVDTTNELAREIIDTMRAERGVYRFSALEALTIEVLPTEIKDQDGQVTSVVG
jgi:suppressor of fused